MYTLISPSFINLYTVNVLQLINQRLLATGPPTTKLLCKFKYWNYSIITSVRSVEKVYNTCDFSITGYHLETKHLVNLNYKKGHNSGKNCWKFVNIELDLDTPKIHLYTTPSICMTFHSQVIIWKTKHLKIRSTKKGHNSGKYLLKIYHYRTWSRYS